LRERNADQERSKYRRMRPMLTMGNFLLVLSESVRANSIARSHDDGVMNIAPGVAI
jgi:hypothetical protein